MSQRIIILTGLSGSGKSCAARSLEDEGYFVVDNLPLNLLQPFLLDSLQAHRHGGKIAVVIDVRNREFLTSFQQNLDLAQTTGAILEIVFFDADDEVLKRRYSETRRRHPLAGTDQIAAGISRERDLLQQVRSCATRIIDTSWMTPHQLRQQVASLYSGDDTPLPMAVLLQSFGFRYGVPSGSDIVLDVRFLPNPHFVRELQALTGLDPAVQDFVLNNKVCKEFMQHLEKMIAFLLPQYRQEGKSYLTISIGCTGGRHRSVSLVEHLRKLPQQEGVEVKINHRDVGMR